ncbi:MAG: hypothetical protein QM811_28205 [Pirellulales bacterium]
MSASPGYDHTQHAPLGWILYGVAALDFAVVVWAIGTPTGYYVAGPISVVLAVLASGFQHLHVTDLGDRLQVAFGPTPIFRRTLSYDDITAVAVDRSTLLEGWGIHASHRGGWIWNLWGRDCVHVTTRKSQMRIGTDDAEGLAGYLQSIMTERKTPTSV